MHSATSATGRAGADLLGSAIRAVRKLVSLGFWAASVFAAWLWVPSLYRGYVGEFIDETGVLLAAGQALLCAAVWQGARDVARGSSMSVLAISVTFMVLVAASLAPEPLYPHQLKQLAEIGVVLVVVCGWMLHRLGPGSPYPFWMDLKALRLWAGFAGILLAVALDVERLPGGRELDPWGVLGRWVFVASVFLVFDIVERVASREPGRRVLRPALLLAAVWGPDMVRGIVARARTATIVPAEDCETVEQSSSPPSGDGAASTDSVDLPELSPEVMALIVLWAIVHLSVNGAVLVYGTWRMLRGLWNPDAALAGAARREPVVPASRR